MSRLAFSGESAPELSEAGRLSGEGRSDPPKILARSALGPACSPHAQQERDDDRFAPRRRQLRTLPWPDAREALASIEGAGGIPGEAGFQCDRVPGRPRANG